jgi:hypothetical protein
VLINGNTHIKNTSQQRNQVDQRYVLGKGVANVKVDGSYFGTVAAALRDGTITIDNGRSIPNGTAQYQSRGNIFRFAQNLATWSRAFDALVVHESIHADFDLTKVKMAWIDNELAGYIAQGFYLRNSGFPIQRLDEDGHVFAAYKYAKAVAAEDSYDAGIWLDVLKKAIEADSGYASYVGTDFEGDG